MTLLGVRLLANEIDWRVRTVHVCCVKRTRYLQGLNTMTYPNYLIYLHTGFDLYACIFVAAVAMIGAGMVGASIALALKNRR